MSAAASRRRPGRREGYAAAICLLALLCVAGARAGDDLLIADFEGQDYGNWKVEGEAFGTGPARGTLPHQMEVSDYAGHGLVNSFHKGDGSKGRLISPEFKIERQHITFLIGGGGWLDQTCMHLVVGTNIVRSVVGPNTEPGGSEALEPAGWDVGEFIGRTAHIEIVDEATGGWGHINVDHIVQSDRPAPVVARPVTVEREIALAQRYLLFPVANGAKKSKQQRAAVLVDGQVVRQFDIELSDEPDWFAHLDVGAWKGRKAVVRVERIPGDAKAPAMITQSDTLWREDGIYREPLRGQFHFSSRRGWNNDPNGMVFADGEYHLYYQHNPYGWPWGNMHWGHAVSTDMVHWIELPIAIYPPRHGDWVFSGSAVVDRDNTSGWKKGTNDLIVAAFTSTARGECIVHSSDGGRTFTEYEGNPVVKHKGRDPRLLWHEPSKRWVMAVYTEPDGTRAIAFHTSPDLKTWTYQSRIEGFYECPDLFELPVADSAPAKAAAKETPDGAAANAGRKWILTAASSEYMVGGFDGREFKPETPKLKGHSGRGFYAAQTFTHEPKGRVVQIGWFQTATPGMPFNQSMSIPCELKLVSTPEGPRLTWTPVTELASLRARKLKSGAMTIKEGDANPLADLTAELVELRASIEPVDATEVSFVLRGLPVVYDPRKQELAVNGLIAPAPLQDGRLDLIVYVDRTGAEVFASGGQTFVPMPFVPSSSDLSLAAAVKGGAAKLESLEIHELRSAWPGR